MVNIDTENVNIYQNKPNLPCLPHNTENTANMRKLSIYTQFDYNSKTLVQGNIFRVILQRKGKK